MLVIGLGNKGCRYKNTRHNIGKEIVGYCAEFACSDKFEPILSLKDVLGEYKKCGDTIYFLPNCFMNESGIFVQKAMNKFYKKPQDLIVVYDDMDLEFGKIKISVARSAGGHNGVKDIIDKIGKEFIKVRIGISRPQNKNYSDYVLSRFSDEQTKELSNIKEKACKVIDTVLNFGVDLAMNKFN